MDINTSLYTDYLSSNYTSSTTNNINKMSDADMSSKSDDELMNACKEFETYFIEQVFKEMKKSVHFTDSQDPADSTLVDYYTDELVREYASAAADQSENGLAKMLYEQMKRNYSIDEVNAIENSKATETEASKNSDVSEEL